MFRIDWPERRPPRLMNLLHEYLDDPQWIHAPYVLPLWAGASQHPSSTDLPWGAALDPGLVQHLLWSLQSWTAFRGRGDLKTKRDAFQQHLPAFIKRLRSAFGKTGVSRLADLDVAQLDSLCDDLDDTLPWFAQKVKEAASSGSYVLPSKAAHLLFPAFIPAYDRAVVELEILHPLLPPRLHGRKTFRMWLRLIWWCLQELKQTNALNEARESVFEHLTSNWTIARLQPQAPVYTTHTAFYADTFLAEYIFIALSRRRSARITPLE